MSTVVRVFRSGSVVLGVALVPMALIVSARVRFGGWSPLHGSGPVSGWVWRFIDALSRPMTSVQLVDVVIRVGLIIGWIALLTVLAAVPAEVAALRSGHDGRRGFPSRAARLLVGGVVLASQPMTASMGAVLAAEVSAVVDDASTDAVDAVDVWTVEAGDSVYGIAERLAEGDSSRVLSIAEGILELNLDTEMIDGTVFTNPAAIRPGWRLSLPALDDGLVDAPPSAGASQSGAVHVVAAGDTLASIARDRLGSPDRWPELFAVNVGRHMNDGRVFESADLIIPGWELTVPDVHAASTVNVPRLPDHIVDEIANWRPDTTTPALTPTVVPSPTASTVAESTAAPVDAAVPLAEPDGRWVEMAGATMLAAGVVGALATRRRRGLRRVRRGERLRHRTPGMVAVERAVMSGAASLDALDRMVVVDLAVRSIAPALVDSNARLRWLDIDASRTVRVALDREIVAPAAWVSADTYLLLEEVPDVPEGVFPLPTLVQIGTDDMGRDVFVDVEMASGIVVDGDGGEQVVAAMVTALEHSPFAEHCTIIDADSADSLDLGDEETAMPYWEARVLMDDPIPPVLVAGDRSLRPLTIQSSAPITLSAVDDGSWWRFSVDDRRVRPLMLQPTQQTAIDHLTRDPDVEPEPMPTDGDRAPADWSPPILVRVLGEPVVEAADGTVIGFERAKSTELIAWLATHRERPTRARARAALWDADIRAATFSNVVSDARRSLARAVAPRDGDEWIDRTLTEELAIHPDVRTDADVLRVARDTARPLPPASAVRVLRPALELVRGLPFAGTAYLWPDPEGITSELVVLATGAAAELASWYLALGDLEGVIWATGRGLQVLPGHEELIALRMRARSARGDTAGLRQEWASYERVLADDWSGGEPAPELVALRRELLAARASASAST